MHPVNARRYPAWLSRQGAFASIERLLKGLDNRVQTQKNVPAVNCPYPLLDLAVTAAFKRKRPQMVVSRK